MEHAIIGKLRTLLREGPRTEAELVYILVEVRKLYEARRDRLPRYLDLLCDWAVHARLTHRKWAKYGPELVNAECVLNVEFRRSLATVFRAESLPEPDWPLAQHLLAEILKDCPLEFEGEPYELTVGPNRSSRGSWTYKFQLKRSRGDRSAPRGPDLR